MPAEPRIIPVACVSTAATVRLERRALHRFLVGYMTSRQLQPHPSLRALLIAGIDVYPGPFPIIARDLESHLDAVVRVKLPYDGYPHAVSASVR